MLFGYRFSGIPDIVEQEDEFPASNLAVDPNDQPIKYLRGATIAEINKIQLSHSDACWALIIPTGIDYCVECEERARRIVQHPWTELSILQVFRCCVVTRAGIWEKPKKCQRCKEVACCDKECQMAAWKTHKAVCTT